MDAWEGFEEGYARTRHGELFYRHMPSGGRRVVFLHGVGARIGTWRPLIPHLHKDIDAYMVDLLGHGNSDAPDIDYSITVQVDSVSDMMENLGIGQPVVFGNSYGGWIGGLLAAGGKLGGLVLEDTAGLDYYINGFADEGKLEGYKASLLRELMGLGFNSQKVMESIVGNLQKSMLTHEVLSAIKCRTQVIWGSNDRVVPIAIGERLRDLINGCAFDVVDGADHVPHFSKPEEVGRILGRFLGLIR